MGRTRCGRPPPLAVITGVADEATAASTAVDATIAYGIAPEGLLRQATLTVIGIDIKQTQ